MYIRLDSTYSVLNSLLSGNSSTAVQLHFLRKSFELRREVLPLNRKTKIAWTRDFSELRVYARASEPGRIVNSEGSGHYVESRDSGARTRGSSRDRKLLSAKNKLPLLYRRAHAIYFVDDGEKALTTRLRAPREPGDET